MMLLILLVLAVLATVADSSEKLLCGRTGNGKSYIANTLGCDAQTCRSVESCTQVIQRCANGVIDTIGLDDGREHVVTHHGKLVTLSGLTYPMWALFDYLERDKISDVEFYLVHDANNMRTGTTGQQFINFVKDVLQCSYKDVVNKYEAGDSNHNSIAILKGAVVVKKNQKDPVQLSGPKCDVKLPANWRDLLVSKDYKGMATQVKNERCKTLASRIDDFKSKINHSPDRTHDGNNCQYWGETGGQYCKGFKLFGKCGNWEPYRGWKTDHDCVRRRDQHNHQVNVDNQHKREANDHLRAEISKLERSRQEQKC